MIARLHATYGKDVMMARGYLHSMRQFFAPSPSEQAVAAQEKRLAQARGKEKRVAHISGRQMHLKAALELGAAHRQQGTPHLRGHWQRAVVRRAGAAWARLAPQQKQHYEGLARQQRGAQQRRQDEMVELALQARDLERSRVATVEPDRRRQMLLSHCRFNGEGKGALNAMVAKGPSPRRRWPPCVRSCSGPPVRPCQHCRH
jgi:hypothetical protein